MRLLEQMVTNGKASLVIVWQFLTHDFLNWVNPKFSPFYSQLEEMEIS